ncbi:MAG: hypothetical protein OEW37_00110 [Rhodospirillaceae bacterium]|nr:hypothetical protein [Rhodospirillaceae bacterium]
MSDKVFEEHRLKMKELNDALKAFDFFYEYADDPEEVIRGKVKARYIANLVKRCGQDGDRLYRAHKDTVFYPGNGFAYKYGVAYETLCI